MSDKALHEHAVCILADADDKLVEKLSNNFSVLSTDVTIVDPTVLETKTFKEINRIFQQSTYLILFLNSKNLESFHISYAVQCFDALQKEKSIISIFTGDDFGDPKVSAAPIIRKLGNRLIESSRFSSSELLNAICMRMRGFSDFMEKTQKNGADDLPAMCDNIFPIRNSSLKLKRGDILDSTCDVIVSSDDNLLTHGGGVSLAIFEAGGAMLETDARKHLPASLGDVVVTTAGKLAQKMIFHAITIALVKDGKNNDSLAEKEQIDIQEYIISNVIRRCFQLLSSLQLSSIAFPIIGSGAAKIPFQKALSCMLKTFSKEISRTAQPWEIELWIYHDNGVDINSLAKTILTPEKKAEAASQPVPPRMPAKYDIFISYSRQDIQKIQKILAFMKEKGFSYWIDFNGIYSGENYKSVIVQSIRQAKIVLFFSSVNSNNSENVIKEISCAVSNKKTIIPVKIDQAHYSDDIEYDLTNIDFIDMVNDDEALKKLYCSIASKL